MNSVVQEQADLQNLSGSSEQAVAPIVLTAKTPVPSRRDIIATLRRESFDLRYVPTCHRLPEAIDHVQADIVLVDMDAADLCDPELPHMSGHRLVTILARQLAQRNVALVVMTSLDFEETLDLARAGIHAFVTPDLSASSFIGLLRGALLAARRRYESCPAGPSHAADRTVSYQGSPSVSLPAAGDKRRISEEVWRRMQALLPPTRCPERTRPIDRRALEAIFYILRSGTPWSRLPKSFGSATTARERIQYWTTCGIMEQVLAAGLASEAGWEHLHWERLAPAFARPIPMHAGGTAVKTGIAGLQRSTLCDEAGHLCSSRRGGRSYDSRTGRSHLW